MATLQTQIDVAMYMVNSKTAEEWNERLDDVKNNNKGKFPRWFDSLIVKSGLLKDATYNFDEQHQARSISYLGVSFGLYFDKNSGKRIRRTRCGRQPNWA